MKPYFIRILLSIDQGCNVLFLNGYEDETISSYVGRKYHGKWQERVIDWLFLRITGKRYPAYR